MDPTTTIMDPMRRSQIVHSDLELDSSLSEGAPPGSTPLNELIEGTAEAIRDGIATGHYPVGARLRQHALAEEFGVSRTPIREALRKLQAEGVVVIEPRRGAVVRRPLPREIREAYAVRAELEGLAAQQAADWISDDAVRDLVAAERQFDSIVGEALHVRERGIEIDLRRLTMSWIDANDWFHEIIQRAASNEQLRRTILFLHRSIPRGLTGAALSSNLRLLQMNASEHTAIREAIENRESDRARALMQAHILRSGEIAASTYERQEAT